MFRLVFRPSHWSHSTCSIAPIAFIAPLFAMFPLLPLSTLFPFAHRSSHCPHWSHCSSILHCAHCFHWFHCSQCFHCYHCSYSHTNNCKVKTKKCTAERTHERFIAPNNDILFSSITCLITGEYLDCLGNRFDLLEARCVPHL